MKDGVHGGEEGCETGGGYMMPKEVQFAHGEYTLLSIQNQASSSKFGEDQTQVLFMLVDIRAAN